MTPEDLTRTIHRSEPVLGDFIGPYKLIRQIGEGGMGSVYQAQQVQPIRRDVALKVIKPGMDSKQVIARFESERQALAIMDHPNIARVFDAGTTGSGLPYFVMELVDGVPISHYCDLNHLTIRERIRLFIPVCDAIQHAHQKGIIHRDIKPSNILVKRQEGAAIPKVIDFGLAKALGPQASDATMLTNFNTVVGTFSYMSPEQAEMGRSDIDTRSDIYSLGAVLYELLTGTTPLERAEGTPYVETLRRIREEETLRPSMRARQSSELASSAAARGTDAEQLPKLLDRELDWIAIKALEKDRTRRYETVNALTRDLQRYLVGEPVEAAPPSATYRLTKFAKRHRAWLAAAAALAITLSVGVAMTTWMAIRAYRAEAEAKAVNTFLRNDVLAQASASEQAGQGAKPDPDLKVRTALDRAAKRVDGKFQTQPLVEAAIRETIGDSYVDMGLYSEAEGQLERALELRRHAQGEAHADTLRLTNTLGDAYTFSGNYDKAVSLLRQTREIEKGRLRQDDGAVLETMNNLALAYVRLARYSDAEPLYKDSLEIKKRVFGPDNDTTLTTQANLGMLYWRQGKPRDAEPLLQPTLQALRRTRGEEHPLTIGVANNLALVYDDLGDYARAEPLHVEVLELQRRILGQEHPNTLSAMGNLGECYVLQGKLSQAEPILIRATEVGRRVQGDEHPSTLLKESKLAVLYAAQGKREQAATLLNSVLQSQRRVLGAKHPDTLSTLAALARVQLQGGNYTESEAALREAIELSSKGASDWRLSQMEALLGASLAGQGKYAEAEPLLLRGYDGMMQRQATMSVEQLKNISEARQNLGKLYRDWGRPDKAAQWQSADLKREASK